jgi:multidrug efflux pump subunit AcrA (membrane-fusion protein)
MQKLWLKVLVGAAILILFLFAKSCYNHKTANLGDTDDKVYVQTITVAEQEMPFVYKTVASIQATKDLKLFSGVRGKVDKIYTPAGTKVVAGERLLSMLPNAEVNAPIGGIVGKWLVKTGEYVKDGDELGRIVDNKELEAEYYVTENLVKYLELGQKVILEFRAFPDAEFIAKVNYISPFIDEKRHSVLVRVNLENKETKLLPGLFANLTHILSINPKALVIPESCIIKNLNGYEVYKVENNKIKKVAVTIGATIKGRTEITSGLNQNDLVVLTIPPGLADGKDVVVEKFTGTW